MMERVLNTDAQYCRVSGICGRSLVTAFSPRLEKVRNPAKYCSGCITLSATDAMAAGLAMALRIFSEEGPFNDADMSGSDRCYGIGEFDCRNPHLVRSHLVSLLIPCRRYIYASGS
jgi:hypothetical protein